MKYGNRQSRQTGVALVLSLLILLVLTVIGVAAMNSTIMQERMAGNASTQADVFELSSEGVTRSLELFYENADDFQFGPYDLSCGQVFGDTDSDGSLADEGAEAWTFPTTAGNWHPASGAGVNPKLEQKMYCCRSWDEVPNPSGGTVWVEHTSKLYALNRATFMGNSQSLALREIEVEMAEAEPDDPTCAICAPGNIGTVSGPNSGSLNVSGNCGAAVVTDEATDPDADATFTAGIGHAAIGNFDGGIVGGPMSEPWDKPAKLAEFVYWAKLGLPVGTTAADAGVGDSNVRGLYIDLDQSNFDVATEPEFSATGGSTSFGTEANPQITFIDGNASFGGNVTGAGIMITRGSLSWNGTPKFNGLLISLGGGYIVSGGGGGGNPSGSMVMTDLDYIDQISGVNSDHQGLYKGQVLHYQVVMDNTAQQIKMYYPPGHEECSGSHAITGDADFCATDGMDVAEKSGAEYVVPVRPVLLGDDSLLGLGSDPELVYYYDASATPDPYRFFLASDSYGSHVKGDELDAVDDGAGNFNITIDYDDGTGVLVSGDIKLQVHDPDGDGVSDPMRDAYGRLIPDFVWTRDNYPEDYGYNPNHWAWDTDTADAQFQWGTTDFTWSGGGNQNFTYDCRALQKVKHELLCPQPLQSLPGAPNDPFYEDPEAYYDDYCWHSNAGIGFTDESGTAGGASDGNYFVDYAGSTPPSGLPENQKAWHMWSPSCDCLGISVDADMIITGWRENLGWRDAEDFQGCDALPSPAG